MGGGAAGTYAAFRLRDEGKKVVVIERKTHLLPGVRDFFARFGIELEPVPIPNYKEELIDFSTGQPITSGNTVNAERNITAAQAALGTYGQIAAQYLEYTFPPLIQLPTTLPEELSMPFGDFVQKYNLDAAVPTIWKFTNYAGDILAETTAYIMAQFGAVHLNATANGGFLVPTTFNNSVLYARAAQQLGSDLLLSSTITSVSRDDTGVNLVVNSNGHQQLIKAKKLLVTAPPLSSILKPLNLDPVEEFVFSQWEYQSAYVGILANTGLPDGLEVVNGVTDSSPNVLNLPGAYGQHYVQNFVFTGVPGLYRTSVIGRPGLSPQEAQQMVHEANGKVAAMEQPSQFVAFASHTPLQVRGTVQGIRSGFYQEAFGLNGRHGTFYAGAAWASDYTSVHWLYLEEVILPMILKSLLE